MLSFGFHGDDPSPGLGVVTWHRPVWSEYPNTLSTVIGTRDPGWTNGHQARDFASISRKTSSGSQIDWWLSDRCFWKLQWGEPVLWLRNLTANYLSADEEAAARESSASCPQPVLLMTCLQSLCKPLLLWLSQKQSLGKHIFTLEVMLLLPWLLILRKTCVVVYEHQTPNICREPLSGAFGTTVTHTKCSTSQTFFLNRENCSLLKSVKSISS